MFLLRYYKIYVLFPALLLKLTLLAAQVPGPDSSIGGIQNAVQVPDKSLQVINDKYIKITNSIDKQTERLLERMQRKEVKLKKRLSGLDSTKANQLFASTQSTYKHFQERLSAPAGSAETTSMEAYIPYLDSIKTGLDFLSKTSAALPAQKLQQLQAASGQVQQLQTKLQVAQEVQQYIRDRETYLKAQLQNTPLYRAVTGINKEVYYYQQRLAGYKALINDPEKLGQKLLSTVSDLPPFQRFFQKNSILSRLFLIPGNDPPPAAVAGLQTRTGVQNILSQRIGAGGTTAGISPQQYFQQQTEAAQSQIQSLKDKLSKLTGGGNSDMTMPDFKPNQQHTKTFFQRIQYSFNIQSQRSTNLLPATSNMALMAGYKLSDNKTIGFGVSYNLGLGNGFNHIKFTSQGVGLRSFADIKLKGSFWLTGGYEYTYYHEFAKFSDIKNLNIWQKSALLGLSKKYSIGKKREGNVQVLYDFLANKEIPHGQPLKFRLGYSF